MHKFFWVFYCIFGKINENSPKILEGRWKLKTLPLANVPVESFGPNDFVSSGNGGDIILWSFKNTPEDGGGDTKVNFELKSTIFCESQTDLTHQRVVFGFARVANFLISTSMDREIKVNYKKNTRLYFAKIRK